MKNKLNGEIFFFLFPSALPVILAMKKKMMYLRTSGSGKLIRAPNFFLINNRYFKAINTGAGHSKTVHISSNSW